MSQAKKLTLIGFLKIALDIAWYFLFAAIAGILLAIAFCLSKAPLPAWFGDAGTSYIRSGYLYFSFPDSKFQDIRLFAAGLLGLAAISVAVVQLIIALLRRLFASMHAGTPFTPENALLVRAIGFVTMGGALIESLVSGLIGLLVAPYIQAAGAEFRVTFGIPWTGLFLGLVILVIAELFRRAATLQEEQDLTV
jgi:hypothetical protein